MAAKRVDPLKAKEAKQKKIAIGGFVILAALLAIQGPKTLKMLKGQSAAPAAEVAPAPVTPGAAPVSAPATGAPAVAAGQPPAAPAAELASVPDSDQPPVVDAGQLATFERFASKDPFDQQAEPVLPKPAAEKPAETEPVVDPTKVGPGTTSGGTDGGFTTGPTPPLPVAIPVAATTAIAVNGVAEDVKVETPFPVAEPTFVLVSIALDGKSVEVGINGGEYANGGETLKLPLGKKITLQNTADGSRFELELVSVQGFPLPKQKG
jgi:hypothetical protein